MIGVGNTICKYCGESVSNFDCGSCLASYRINYELFFVMTFFFTLPSIFIVKGTGNWWYLASSLIGVLICLFNIRYVRDDDQTIRRYEELRQQINSIERYQSGELGILALASENKVLKRSLLQRLNNEEVSKLIHFYESLISEPSIDEQLRMVGYETVVELDRWVDAEYEKYVAIQKMALLKHGNILKI